MYDEKLTPHPDPEMREFEEALLGSMAEVKAGKVRVTTPEQMLVREARAASGLTQEDFAKRIATPVATLRDWEQGRFTPPGAALTLLRVAIRYPEVLREVVA